MLHSVKGIVLSYINYSDTSIIAKIYTDKFGLQSYMVNGVRKKKARIKQNIFQALNLLDLEVYHKQNSSLHRINEVKISESLVNISSHILKSSLALFLKELIYKSIKEEEPNPALFQFLQESILFLETTKNSVSNYHICFLLELTKHLGFYPDVDEGVYFNLDEGVFQGVRSNRTVDKNESALLLQFIGLPINQCHTIDITGKQRNRLLYILLEFYKIHIDSFGNIKSLDVLHTVLS